MRLFSLLILLYTMTPASAHATSKNSTLRYQELKASKTKQLQAYQDYSAALTQNDETIAALTKIMREVIGRPAFTHKPASSRLQPGTLLAEVGYECADGMLYSFGEAKDVSVLVTTDSLIAPYLKEQQTRDLPAIIERAGRDMICNNAALSSITTVTGIERKGLDALHVVTSRSSQDYGPPHAAGGLIVLARKGERLYFMARSIEAPKTHAECEQIWQSLYKPNDHKSEAKAHAATMACYTKFYQSPAKQEIARKAASRMLSLLDSWTRLE